MEPVLEPDELEEVDDSDLVSLFVSVLVALSLDFAALELPVADEEEDSSFFEPPPEDEYKSAYQPPPLRMKFPPLICRLAVDCPHLGQT